MRILVPRRLSQAYAFYEASGIQGGRLPPAARRTVARVLYFPGPFLDFSRTCPLLFLDLSWGFPGCFMGGLVLQRSKSQGICGTEQPISQLEHSSMSRIDFAKAEISQTQGFHEACQVTYDLQHYSTKKTSWRAKFVFPRTDNFHEILGSLPIPSDEDIPKALARQKGILG